MTRAHDDRGWRHGRSPGANVMARLDERARFSSENPVLTRLYLSPQPEDADVAVRVLIEFLTRFRSPESTGNQN